MQYGLFFDKLRKANCGNLFMFVFCCFVSFGLMQSTSFAQSGPPPIAPPAGTNALDELSSPILWFTIVISLILGYFVSLHFHRKAKKELMDSHRKAKKEFRDSLLRDVGFAPATLDDEKRMKSLKENPDGLELFESRLIEITQKAKNNVQLCLLTPLIHSLRKPWQQWNSSFPEGHWARDFCKPFHDALSTRENHVSVEIVYLQDDVLESFIRDKVTPSINDWPGYRAAITNFIEYLKFRNPSNQGGERVSDVLTTQIPKIPFLLAIIDVPTNGGEFSPSTRGLIAFMNEREFHMQRRQRRTPEDIGKKLIPFEFNNPDILAMFSRSFDDLALHQDTKLFDFYKKCLAKSKNGEKYFWGLFTDAEDNIDTRNYTPHKMLLSETAIHGPEKEPGDQMLGE